MTYPIVPVTGGKSGSKGHQPVETPDSLHSRAYAQILDLLSEGEIVGLVNGAASIFFNGTPLYDAATSTYNFPGVSVDFRAGTQAQESIKGIPSAQTEAGVGVALEYGTDWTQALTNVQLSAVRIRLGVPALSALQDNGDLTGHRIEYEIAVQTDGGAFVVAVAGAFDGKTTQLYERSHRINLPAATTGWTVRVRRLTAQANSAKIQDTTVVQSITSIVDEKLRYPMSALVALKMDARPFQSVPTRAYHLRGRIVRVPTNYNATTRVYSGLWDGLWQLAYTNNPAWIFLDLVTNDRYGLGEYIPPAMADKWSLYRIAVYCDDRVDDGRGGLEPRFTCNCYLQGRSDAWRVVQDLASIFRGIAYYAAGTVFASADMPTDPVYTFTAANVIDGAFEYQGSPRTARHTVALVSWNDMTDLGRAKVEAVDDPDGIARYGIRQVELTAFGCTSQAQARRVGKWSLLTSRLETDIVNFAVGLDGAVVVPGQVIRIADPNRAGRRMGGRIHAATATVVETDATVEVTPGDRLTIHTAAGISQTRTVTNAVGSYLKIDWTALKIDRIDEIYSIDKIGLAGSTTSITVSPPFSESPAAGTIWTVESEQLWAQTYRVVSVTEREGSSEEAKTFGIAAVEHVVDKFSAIDFGTVIQERPISVVPPGVMAPPAEVEIAGYYVIEQQMAGYVARIVWTRVPRAVAYDVEWRRNHGEWVRVPRTGSTSAEIRGVYTGAYVARVRSVNVIDTTSIWTSSTETHIAGKTDPPPAVATFTASTDKVFAIELKWTFPDQPLDIERTEIWQSPTPSFGGAVKMGDFAFPTRSASLFGLSAGAELWFWARLVDTTGNLGPFVPLGDGVHGQASASAAVILDYLLGQITSTQLGSELLETIEGAETSVVDIQTIENELAALYTIKTQLNVNGRRYIAGIGVGVENNNGVIESQVLVAADRFAVLDPNGAEVALPFVIQGGQVFMQSAFIQNASIDDAKIVSLNANKILANSLSAITANLGTVYAGMLQNHPTAPSFVLNLNAAGSALLMRAGAAANYGVYAGTHYPVEIYADGDAFFGREVVAGGTVKGYNDNHSIYILDRPAVAFTTTVDYGTRGE